MEEILNEVLAINVNLFIFRLQSSTFASEYRLRYVWHDCEKLKLKTRLSALKLSQP